MKKKILTLFGVLLCFSLFLGINSFKKAENKNVYAQNSLIFSLDFSNSENLGKNSANSSIGDAEVVNNDNSFTVSEFNGKKALNFSGNARNNAYLKIPTKVLNNGEITLAFWVNVLDGNDSFARLFEINKDLEPNRHLTFMPYYAPFENQTVISMKINGLANDANNNQYSLGLSQYSSWQLLTITLSSDGINVYKNLSLIYSENTGDYTPTQFLSDRAYFLLGSSFWSGDTCKDFKGSVCDFRIYNKILSINEIKTEFNVRLSDFLTASYDFETDATQEKISGQNAVINGNAKKENVEINGEKKGVLSLDGSFGETRDSRTGLTLPNDIIRGHNELTISTNIFISQNSPLYSRIWEFAVGEGKYISLIANFLSKGTLRFEYMFSNETGKEVCENPDYVIPFNTWINVSVTVTDKQACLYVNGLPLSKNSCSYDNLIFSQKSANNNSVGRTLFYNDNPFIGYIDGLDIYSYALSEKQIMELNGVIKTLDDKTAVENQAKNFTLSYKKGSTTIEFNEWLDDGVRVTVSSSNPSVVTNKGKITIPNTDTSVTLTVTLKRGEYSMTKKFDFTISSEKPSVYKIDKVEIEQSAYDKNSYYYQLMLTNVEYMMSLDKERLMYNFRRIAGLSTNGATSYGAWISPESGGAGQFEAQYVSALARACVTLADYKYNGESVKDRLNFMITELKKCQDANTTKGDVGYLMAISTKHFDVVQQGGNKVTDDDGTVSSVWVPWYFLHKMLAGLYDTFIYCPDEQIKTTAKTMMIDLADWTYNKMNSYSQEMLNTVLSNEFGGMAEILYQIYGVTKNANYKITADLFQGGTILKNVYNNVECLKGLHANTTIPKFLGTAACYEQTGDEYYLTICKNAFEMIMKRIYATGGTSNGEFWKEDSGTVELVDYAMETCCSYNMLKLADYLYRFTGEKKYMDYYEKTYLNHILASMDPDSAGKCYPTPATFGRHKVYSSPTDSFWCCCCTGQETFTKLQYGIYAQIKDELNPTLIVNMFMPSSVKVNDDISVIQSGDFYDLEKTTFTIKGNGRFTLSLRIPEWIEKGYSIKYNGNDVIPVIENGYLKITKNFKNDDVIEYSVPFSYRLEKLLGSENQYALFYGPILLVADLGTQDVNDIQSVQGVFGSEYSGDVKDYMALDGQSLDSYIVKNLTVNSLLAFTFTANNQTVNFKPFNQTYHNRYGMYFTYFMTKEELKKATKSVDGGEYFCGFTTSDLSDFVVLGSNSNVVSFENKNLTTSSSGEFKIVTKKIYSVPFEISVDISSPFKRGSLNGGIYLFASDANGKQDKINALNVQIEKPTGKNVFKVYIHKFTTENGYEQTLFVSEEFIQKENEIINLKVVAESGKVYVYVDNSLKPDFEYAIDSSYESGSLGVRSHQNSCSFDNLRIVSKSNPVGYNELNELILLCKDVAENKYCKTSYQNYLQILNKAKNMVNGKTANNQSEVENMVNTLNYAVKNLIEKGDCEVLFSIISLAEKIDRKLYTVNSLYVLDELISEIKDNYSDYDEQTVSEKEKALANAIQNLVIDPDYNPDSDGNSSSPSNPDSSSGNDSASGQNSSQCNSSASRQNHSQDSTSLSSNQTKNNAKSGCSAHLNGKSIILLSILTIVTLTIVAKRNKRN